MKVGEKDIQASRIWSAVDDGIGRWVESLQWRIIDIIVHVGKRRFAQALRRSWPGERCLSSNTASLTGTILTGRLLSSTA